MPESTPQSITFVSAIAHCGSLSFPSSTIGAPAVERAQMASWRGGCAPAVAASMHAVAHDTASVVKRFMVRSFPRMPEPRSVGVGTRGGRGPYAVVADEPCAGAGSHRIRAALGEVAARRRCKRLHPGLGQVNE